MKEPNKENAKAVIESAYLNPQVESAEYNYIYTIGSEPKSATVTDNGTNSKSNYLFAQNYADGNASALSLGVTVNDTHEGDQYALRNSRIERAWVFQKGSSNIKVGIMDSGISSHRDLGYNTALSKNFTTETGLWDSTGHGTHVAGIIGAKPNNGYGVAGVCWNVTLVNLKVMYRVGEGRAETSNSIVASAITYAASKSIKVLNFSGELYEYNDALKKAIDAYNGIIVVAAGNISDDHPFASPNYLSRYGHSSIISVASVDSNNQMASHSRYSATMVDLAAPGVDIMSTAHDNTSGYLKMSGTSMATPYITGTVALLLSINPNFTISDIRRLLLENVSKNTSLTNIVSSGGTLNVLKSVLKAYGYALGDADMNGQVTAADARLTQRFSAKLETPNQKQKVIVDVNYDNKVDSADARMILQFSAQLIDSLSLDSPVHELE